MYSGRKFLSPSSLHGLLKKIFGLEVNKKFFIQSRVCLIIEL